MPTKLGQNFLRDGKVLEKIIESSNLKADDFVIEVGPGEGILTEKLAEKTSQVLAIEIDKKLIPALHKKFSKNEKIKIINEDILKINLEKIISSKFEISNKNDDFSYKVIANIPYYITSPIIRLFLEAPYPPKEMILMIQKEVAQRICASPSEIITKNQEVKNNSKNYNLIENDIKQSIPREKPGKMSLLSVSVQYYAKPEILFYVDRKSFYPIPEVDSAVIKISKINENKKIKKGEERENFFRVVRAGFSSKRKTLLNNISSSFHLEKKEVDRIIEKTGIDLKKRAQELSIEDWEKIARVFKK